MSNRRPWYPWYPDDFERDTHGLSDDAELMYRRLLDMLWKNGGFLPYDEDYLCKRLGKRRQFFRRVFAEIEHYFKFNGREFYQKRLLAEFNNTVKIQEQRQDAASKRWGKKKPGFLPGQD
jgi:uncharacterized protein YdaU (DUF1376 family)